MNEIKTRERIINSVLDKLYLEQDLFENDVCERCIVFRFSYHLQNELNKSFENVFVDCDYNASYKNNGNGCYTPIHGKEIIDSRGRSAKRYVDIIVRTKKDLFNKLPLFKNTDYVCFECKKENNKDKEGRKKDIENLKYLTSNHGYGYYFGFHLIFGKQRGNCKFDIYKLGRKFLNRI